MYNTVSGRNEEIIGKSSYNFVIGKNNSVEGDSNILFGNNNKIKGSNNTIVANNYNYEGDHHVYVEQIQNTIKEHLHEFRLSL
jgi:hypothetical protein